MLISLVNFGLVVLIWMVQLIVYPGFKYYEDQALIIWHKKYTVFITIIVLPLMFLQLALSGIYLFESFSILKLISFVLVLSTWGVTFAVAVPLHSKISEGNDLPNTVNSLVSTNWIRTVIWSLIFVLHFFS